MESITPPYLSLGFLKFPDIVKLNTCILFYYLSLGFLKFPDIVKLNTCILFYDYFHHDKFPSLPVSLVSELHNYSTRSCNTFISN